MDHIYCILTFDFKAAVPPEKRTAGYFTLIFVNYILDWQHIFKEMFYFFPKTMTYFLPRLPSFIHSFSQSFIWQTLSFVLGKRDTAMNEQIPALTELTFQRWR